MLATAARQLRVLACITLVVACACSIGCVNSLKNTIPAQCLPPEFLDPSRDDLIPIDFTILGQVPPPAHVIAPGDILGIYIHGVLGRGQGIEPETHFPAKFGDSATGNFTAPAVGSPVTVMADGTIELPHVPPVTVVGMTLSEAVRKIREEYTALEQLQPGRDVIRVTVIKPRSVQVLVLREDSIMNWPIFKQNNSTLAVKRGSGRAVDLPIYQNDVLHALTETGGLPGSDACDEVWVLHGAHKEHWEAVAAALGKEVDQVNGAGNLRSDLHSRIVKVPLKVLSDATVKVAPSDMILENGDVVFIPARDREHFFVGGVLGGQQVYLPRDYELDVLAAISMAGGSPAGPPNGGGLFSGQSPGILLPPTRVLILRKVPGGEQVTIHVDLKKALRSRKERIPVRPGDVILLQFTPCQIVGNFLLNVFQINLNVSRGYFTNVP